MDYNPLTNIEIKETENLDNRICEPINRAWCLCATVIIVLFCAGAWLFLRFLA